ncbi:flagellar protein FlaG [Shewanella sp.]|uniref:flagellar protein FlaG n=1 Tax=Shewanella sp. TaxID=50422 RepID=UPI003A974BE8
MMDISISSSNAVVAKTDVSSAANNAKAEQVVKTMFQQKDAAIELEQQAQTQSEQNDAMSAEDLQGVVEQLSSNMEMMKKGLQFRVDDDSGTNIVSVMDISSGEVIRQIPSEEALELASKLSDVAAGLLMKTEA